jgi:uncharacterized protein
MSIQPNNTPLDSTKVIQTLKQQPQLFEQFHLKSLALFGSTSRDQATVTSDLDFLVEFNAELTFDLYMDLKFYLEDLFNKKVDLVIKTDLKPQIKETVIKEALYVS